MKTHLLLTLCFAVCCALSPNAQANLIAHFDFEEGVGTNTASTVGGFTGTLNGDPQWVTTGLAPVPSGTTAALQFDGTGDFVLSDYAGVGGSSDRTVSFWMQATNTLNTGIVAWGNSATPNGRKWHVRLNDNPGNGPVGAIRSEIQGSYEIDGPVLTDGNWHHVAAVYGSGGAFGSGQVQHYIDGILVSDGQLNTGGDTVLVNTLLSPSIAGSASSVIIGGRRQGTTNSSFNGLLDEVRIYDSALSASEVMALATIPEPSALTLFIVGGVLMLCRRRK